VVFLVIRGLDHALTVDRILGKVRGMSCCRIGLVFLAGAALALRAGDLRIGLIGLDTSHVVAFTQLLNEAEHKDHVPGARVTAAFRGGSPDVEASRTRIDGFTQQLFTRYGVQLHDSIEALCQNVDAVMIESVDGRPHLAQAIPVLQAGKPLFIDKPMAASLGDVLAIFRLAKTLGVPVFSSSSLRYGQDTQRVRQGAIGRVSRAETRSPCSQEPHHPELFWYGIHGVEALFAVMGQGCESVRRGTNASGAIQVTGTWTGGRTGVYLESHDYGGSADGDLGNASVGSSEGYAPLLREVVKFFRTGAPPVAPEETIELFAFMEASDESLRRGGEAVTLAEVFRRYGYRPQPTARLEGARRIWDAAPHNAFTDLIRFRDRWICAFREGKAHVSPDGSIRLIQSVDGENWEPLAFLQYAGADLRDPKLSLMPDGRLMVIAAAAFSAAGTTQHQTYAWFSSDGLTWDAPLAVGEPNFWLWRVRWHKGYGYGVGYQTAGGGFTRLYRSEDGRRFDVIVPRLCDQAKPSEATLVFRQDDSAVCLLRRDGAPGTAQLGFARPPYTAWTWNDLGVAIGGPNLLELPDGRLIAAGRLTDRAPRTAIGAIDVSSSAFSELLELPSGGDTSYPGMVWQENRLWVSYYSSHEGKARIYLARVAFPGVLGDGR